MLPENQVQLLLAKEEDDLLEFLNDGLDVRFDWEPVRRSHRIDNAKAWLRRNRKAIKEKICADWSIGKTNGQRALDDVTHVRRLVDILTEDYGIVVAVGVAVLAVKRSGLIF